MKNNLSQTLDYPPPSIIRHSQLSAILDYNRRQCGATAERRTRDRDSRVRNSLVPSGLIGIARWPSSRPTPLKCKNEDLALARVERSPRSSRLYRLGVSQAQIAKVSGDERQRLRAL